MDSETSASILKYRIFPENVKLPHIVINAHSVNDVRSISLADSSTKADKLHHEILPNFINEARGLSPCDDHLPIVTLLDDFSLPVTESNLHSGNLYSLASYYDLMGVNMNAILKTHMIEMDRGHTVYDPLLGSQVSVHPGMGYHIGVAWTMLFNLINPLVDVCNDLASKESRFLQDNEIWASHRPMWLMEKDLKNNRTEGKPTGPVLHAKDLGAPITRGIFYDNGAMTKEWTNRHNHRKNICKEDQQKRAKGEPPMKKCTYSWIISDVLGISRPEHLQSFIEPKLKSNYGWKAKGNPIVNPRTGWYVDQPSNATFTMEIEPELATNILTIISMKSYSDKWKQSLLKVSISVVKKDNSIASREYTISGYHEMETSVHYTHKLALPEEGAKPGDLISVKFEMLSGSEFKIAGMAFCVD